MRGELSIVSPKFMNIFEIKSPRYKSDREERSCNPIEMSQKYFLPSMNCIECGIWAGSDRIRKKFGEDALQEFGAFNYLSPLEWEQNKKLWAERLGLNAEELTPGAELGMPVATLIAEQVPDFMHPFPGQLIVTSQVMRALLEMSISGLAFAQVEVSFAHDVPSNASLPEFYEFVVVGRAWRKGIEKRDITICETCGRITFSDAGFELDQERWDGAGVFNIDKNPNRIFCTSEVANCFVDQDFSNLEISLV